MTKASNSIALRIIRQYFSVFEINMQIVYLLRLAFPTGQSFSRIERITSQEYKEVFQKTAPQMSLPPDIMVSGMAYLESLGMKPDDWHVCFINRDDKYLAKAYPKKDWSYHDYRNSSITNYISAMELVVSKGGWAIRVGSIVSESLPKDLNPHIIDYASNDSTETLDLFLVAQSRLFVVGNTGLSAIASAFGKPCAFANLIPLSHVDPFMATDRFIPKTLKNSSNKVLSFDEMFELGIFSSDTGSSYDSFYKDNKVSVIENDPADIRALVEEMLEPIVPEGNEFQAMQHAFKKRYFTHKIDPQTEVDIAASFLKRHAALLPTNWDKKNT